MEMATVWRWMRIALPFVLVAAGAVVLYISPWPAILHQVLAGARVRVAWTWETLGQPLLALACWAAAIWLSLQVRRGD